MSQILDFSFFWNFLFCWRVTFRCNFDLCPVIFIFLTGISPVFFCFTSPPKTFLFASNSEWSAPFTIPLVLLIDEIQSKLHAKPKSFGLFFKYSRKQSKTFWSWSKHCQNPIWRLNYKDSFTRKLNRKYLLNNILYY